MCIKKELITNAVTLFRWATKESLSGRTICSRDEMTGEIKQLEMPALTAISDSVPPELSPAERKRRLTEPARPLSEVLSELKEGEPHAAQVDRHLDKKRRARAL